VSHHESDKPLRGALPVAGMRELLLLRKAALEQQTRARFAAARENGTTADVRALSAVLRAVKRQLAIAATANQRTSP